MMNLQTSRGHLMVSFDSQAEVTNYIDPDLFQFQGESFVGEQNLDTWPKVHARTQRDWQEGLYIIQEFVDELLKQDIPEIKSHKRRVEFDEVEGDEVDLERLYQGQAAFRSSKREATTGPRELTIMIDTTTPAFKDSKDILWRGAAALALSSVLEEKGYSVEIWVVNGSALFKREYKPVYTSCCLKRCSDPMDMSTLVNTVSGWCYRSVTFALLDTICKNFGKEREFGYGQCETPTMDDLDCISKDELRVYASGVFSFQGALSMIQAELEKVVQLSENA